MVLPGTVSRVVNSIGGLPSLSWRQCAIASAHGFPVSICRDGGLNVTVQSCAMPGVAMSRVHVVLSIAAVVVAANASAHHGIANFDLNKDIAISGTVSKLAFVNPHSWL